MDTAVIIVSILIVLFVLPETRDFLLSPFGRRGPKKLSVYGSKGKATTTDARSTLDEASVSFAQSMSQRTRRVSMSGRSYMHLTAQAHVYFGFPYLWRLRRIHISDTIIAVYSVKHEFLFGVDTIGVDIEQSRHEHTLKLSTPAGIMRIRFFSEEDCDEWTRAIIHNNRARPAPVLSQMTRSAPD